jgi:hypothetical protein
MRHLLSATILAATAIGISPAAACDSGSRDAQAFTYLVMDKDSAREIGASIRAAFAHNVRKYQRSLEPDPAACAAATFSIGSLHYTMYSDDGKLWPRRASGSASTDSTVYLMTTLSPPIALADSMAATLTPIDGGGGTYHKAISSELIYVLVAGAGSDKPWSVYGMFDRIPDTERLAQLMCQAAIGSLPVGAIYDPSDRSVTLKDPSVFVSFADRGGDGGPCTVAPTP